jgi:voltage-gated potassium channel
MLKARQRLFALLEGTDTSRPARAVHFLLVTLIALNVVAMMAASVHDLEVQWERPLSLFEMVSVTVFLVEYVLRVWVAPEREGFSHPLWGRLRYLVTPLAILDLLAVTPALVPLLAAFDLRFLRAVRMLRMMRVTKFGRYSRALKILRGVIADRRDELLATGSILLLVVVLASSLMFEVEHEAQPTVFTSIPAAMWWAAATLTTMGIDIRPITPLGKILAACIAVCGVGLFAIPAGILGSGFVERYLAQRQLKRICPHCGKSPEDPVAGDTGQAP